MGENTKISWTNHTVNLHWGCTKTSRGCKNCFAEDIANRYKWNVWGEDNPRGLIVSWKPILNKIQKRLNGTSKLETVFVGSMMDIFEESKQGILRSGAVTYDTGLVRNEFFELVDQNFYPNIVFLLLTKRPNNISKMIPTSWYQQPPENVWFGASVCTQNEAEIIPFDLVAETPIASKRFLSVEPLLEEVDLGLAARFRKGSFISGKVFEQYINWVIVGGESGRKAREMKPTWAQLVMNTFKDQEIPVFMKQMGSKWAKGINSEDSKGGDMEEWPGALQVREYPRWIT